MHDLVESYAQIVQTRYTGGAQNWPRRFGTRPIMGTGRVAFVACNFGMTSAKFSTNPRNDLSNFGTVDGNKNNSGSEDWSRKLIAVQCSRPIAKTRLMFKEIG